MIQITYVKKKKPRLVCQGTTLLHFAKLDQHHHTTNRHVYLFCGIVSKGTAVVREAPAEEAARQRRQEESVSRQDHNLFFQTQYLTHWASRQLCRNVDIVSGKRGTISKKLWNKVRVCFY